MRILPRVVDLFPCALQDWSLDTTYLSTWTDKCRRKGSRRIQHSFCRKAIAVILLFNIVNVVFAETDESILSLTATPGISIPLGSDLDYFKLGGGVNLQSVFKIPHLSRILSAGVDIDYSLSPLNIDTEFSSLSFLSGGARIGIQLEVLPKLSLGVFARAGYYYSFFSEDPDSSGNNPYVGGGLAIFYRLFPSFSLGIGASYRDYLGLYSGLQIAFGASLHYTFSPRQPIEVQIDERPALLTEKGRGVQIVSMAFDNIFPVFFKYYDSNPIGKATIKNYEAVTVEDVQTTFYVRQYMDNPKEVATIERLAPGEEREIAIYALFTEKVLDITESTKVSALLSLTYRAYGIEKTTEYIETVRLQNRNAMTWDDDRRASAFVTARDPAVLKLAKNVAAIIKDREPRGVDKNILLAIALHETLDLYGIAYTSDPITPYIELSTNATEIDYLQFPKQTLEFMTGACDDLSILYSALLEAVGVETAFVTTPGHIFIAFKLDMTADEARTLFLYPDDFIYDNGTVWLPVEITVRNQGFLKAWQIGAKQWRENTAKEQSAFFPMHASWETYEPVGFPGTPLITLPDRIQIMNAFQMQVERFVEQEISLQAARLQEEIDSRGSVRAINKLGILYAKYGLDEKAIEQFEEILESQEYVPVLLNSGNIYFLQGDYETAWEYYKRAEAITPDNRYVLLGIARVAFEEENYGMVRKAYNKLKEIAPNVASRFSYLELRGEEASKASAFEVLRSMVVWDEE